MSKNCDTIMDKFLFDNAPDMMAVLAIGGKFINCNKECTNILGYSKEELLSMDSCYDIFTSDSVSKALVAREHIAQGKPFKNLEVRLIKKDKTKLDVLCNIAAIKDQENNCYRTLAIWRESTELVQARKKLEQQNESLSLFVHAISHDLSAPLRGISSISQLLYEELKEDIKKSSQGTWAALLKRIERLNIYFHDIRTYLIGNKALIEEQVNTQDIVENILGLLVKPVGFQAYVGLNMPSFTTLRIHLQQVFYNLITNAITHHPKPEEGVIHITVKEVGNLYYFSIIDNGPGLSTTAQEKITQHLNFPSEVKPSGMGLSIVKRILDEVGGELFVCSGQGQSNHFTFTWPRQRKAI